MQKRLICASTLAIIALSFSPSWAGDLDPPGQPAATPGPEPRIAINEENTPGDADAHFIVMAPGSYYLEDNFVEEALLPERDGIVIESSNVTIDLNGFTLDGFHGIVVVPPARQIALSTTTGIRASGSIDHITIRNGVVRDWGEDGINLTGRDRIRVENVTAVANRGSGITVGDGSLVTGCLAAENGAAGIGCGVGSVITESVAHANGASGITIASTGIIDAFTRGLGSTVTACASSRNGGNGIFVNEGSLVARCTVAENSGDGIRFSRPGCQALANTCHSNGFEDGDGAGISSSGGCRIDGNHVSNNDIGIETVGADGVIIRNSAQGNTVNYQIFGIGGTHIVGPTVTSSTDPDFTHPWANLSQ